MPRHAEVVHFGVDWITGTARGGELAESLFETGHGLLNEAVTRGNQKKPWSMSGFHGYRAGGVQLATRDDEVMIRLSGDMAHDYWMLVHDRSDNVTRFDVQISLRLDGPVGPTIRRHFEQAQRFSKTRAKPATLSVLSTNNGPSTLYFNRRISDRFGRIYDKGAESKLPSLRNVVRYELELKGAAAKRASAKVRTHSNPDHAAAHMAADFFDARGVSLGKSQVVLRRTVRVANYCLPPRDLY